MDIKALFSKVPVPSIRTLILAVLILFLLIALFAAVQTVLNVRKNSLTVLTEQLYTGELEQREQAIVAIGKKGVASKEAIPDLVAMIRDPSWLIRFRAVEAISNIGLPEEAAIAALVLETQDEVLDVRLKAIEGLANIGPVSREGVFAVLRLFKDDERLIRKAAVDATLVMAEKICQMRDYRKFVYGKPVTVTAETGPQFRSIYNKTQIAKMEEDAQRRDAEWKKQQAEKKRLQDEKDKKAGKKTADAGKAPAAIDIPKAARPVAGTAKTAAVKDAGPPKETPEQRLAREARELEQRLKEEETRESEEVTAIILECRDAIKDEFLPVRLEALQILSVLAGGFSQEQPVWFAALVAPLIGDLKDSNPNVVEQSLAVLRAIGTQEALEALAYHKKYNQ